MTNDKEKSYAERQNECGIKVGDRVKVLRSCEDYEDGWSGSWVSEMNDCVQSVRVVIDIGPNQGLGLDGDDVVWYYPYFVLEKVTEEESNGKPDDRLVLKSSEQVGGRHYKDFEIEPGYFCEHNKLTHFQSSAIKYICRHGLKGDKLDGLKDLNKAIDFINKLIEVNYGDHTK